MARRVSKLFSLYTEEEIKEAIKKEKDIDLARIGKQETGKDINLFLQCKNKQDADKLAEADMTICNLLIQRKNLQKGHMALGRQCYKCGRMGHIMAGCENERVCWSCGETDHKARDCRNTKRCFLCKSTTHGALYGGCPEKTRHNKELVKVTNEEKRKLPVGMREGAGKPTTLTPPCNLSQTTANNKKKRNRKKKNNNKPRVEEKKNESPKTQTTGTSYTLEEKLMSAASAAWGMSRNMPHTEYIANYNKILLDSGMGDLRIKYNPPKEENKEERRVTIAANEETVKGKRKRLQSSTTEKTKRKRVVSRPLTSSDEDTSDVEMTIDTDSGSENVFEEVRARFKVNGPGTKKAIVEFPEKTSHADCDFTKDEFKVLHAENISRAELVLIASSKPQCLEFLD